MAGQIPQLLAQDAAALIMPSADPADQGHDIARDDANTTARHTISAPLAAIEAATSYEKYLHGEAVALRMVIAMDLSCRMGLIDASVKQQCAMFSRALDCPSALGAASRTDANGQKVSGGAMRLVLLEKLGRALSPTNTPRRAEHAYQGTSNEAARNQRCPP